MAWLTATAFTAYGVGTPGLRTTAKCLAVQNFHVEITIGLGVVLLYVFMTTNFEEVQ